MPKICLNLREEVSLWNTLSLPAAAKLHRMSEVLIGDLDAIIKDACVAGCASHLAGKKAGCESELTTGTV